MKNIQRKHYFSTRSFIVLSVLVVIALSFLAAYFGITHFYKKKLTDDLISSTETRTKRLADTLAFYNMDLSVEDTNISSDIDETASFIQGRIMVVSRDYHILKDTYVLKQGDYLISPDVADVMQQKEEKVRRIRGNFAEVIVPIMGGGEMKGAVIATASVESMNERYKFVADECRIIFGCILLLDAIAVIFISRKSMEGIDRVSRQLYHMTLGNLNDKLDEKGFRESRYLAQNYNDILEKLSTNEESRNEFVSNVSHELKTPITSMKVLAESLTETEGASVDDYREFMTGIVDEIDRETKIINDLLTLVRTDSRQAKINFEEKNVNEMLSGVVKTVEPLAKRRGIEISVENYRDVLAEIDSTKLALGISNLVENAVKYNIENGWIHISLNADHKYFYIRVADSGVGIPDDAKEKVFERFYRVDKARSRDTGGTGLGLAITRNIIIAHGGTIKLYSESGKGTTFSLKIPLHQVKNDEKEKNDEDQLKKVKVKAK